MQTTTTTNPAAYLAALDRKVELADLTDELRAFAREYLDTYAGTFEFVVSVRERYQRTGNLSDPQAKGILNCARADLRRAMQAPQQVELEDGMYLHDGTVYKVQHAVHGSGRQYAKQLVVDGFGSARFEFARGMVYKLKASDRMTLEQAREFGALYGTCCVCGATLTDENSIAAGIGPVCATRF